MTARGRTNADGAVLTALASGRTVAQAAAVSGVSERTIYRRLNDPAFRRRVDTTRTQMVEQTVAMLAAAGTEAVGTLRASLSARSEHARVSAARALLEIGQRYREEHELERRISELEAAQGATPYAWPPSRTA